MTARAAIRRHVLAGLAAVLLLVAGIGGWATMTELAGAVVGSGLLVVESNVKKVQHPSGVVVGELRVREGDRVTAGDVLIRLDDTVTRANLAIVVKSLDELAARQARLEAERDGAETVSFPAALAARTGNTGVAQAKGKVTEIELQIIQIDQDLRTEVAKELAEIRGKTAELVERQVAAEDQLKRIDIRAPLAGVVHQLAVHTVGGVINPSEPLMLVVPDGDELTVEARIAPQDIDQLSPGQRAVLRFAAFNQRTTPEIVGQLAKISADVTIDQRTSAAFYVVRIAMPPAEIARLKGLRLVPGMPVETFIETAPRTVLSYLVKPLHDQILKAFRER